MRKLTILDTVDDIYRALDAKAYLSAFALALTLPDILSMVEYPEIDAMGKRYSKWMDEFFITELEKKARVKSDDSKDDLTMLLNRIDGRFYAKLRNVFLHSGHIDVPGMEDVELHISFNGLQSTTVFGHPGGPVWKSHVLSVYDFCMKMCGITEYLVEEWKSVPEKMKRLDNAGAKLYYFDDEDVRRME